MDVLQAVQIPFHVIDAHVRCPLQNYRSSTSSGAFFRVLTRRMEKPTRQHKDASTDYCTMIEAIVKPRDITHPARSTASDRARCWF